jgi:hypothetical protein
MNGGVTGVWHAAPERGPFRAAISSRIRRNDQPVPPRKRKTTYPPPRNAPARPPRPGEPGGPGGPDTPYVRPTVASINLSASAGRAGLKVGDRVRIAGSGLYSGDIATIERLTTGAIPSAVVRTEAGRTRQVRTIDLEPVGPAVTNPASDAADGPVPPGS